MSAFVRAAALAVVGLAGILSLLATSPPPPPRVELSVDPGVVCAGDPVAVGWAVVPAADGSVPSDVHLRTAPIDAFDPPLDGTPIDGEGSVTAVPLEPVYIGADAPGYVELRHPVGVAVLPCDRARLQRDDAYLTAALVGDEHDASALAAFARIGDETLVVRLDDALETIWDASVAGRVEALAVLPDGGFLAAGSTASALGGDAPPVRHAFVQRYDASGDVMWTHRFGSPDATGPRTSAHGVAPLGADVVVVGEVSASGQPSEGFVRRLLGTDGSLVWHERVVADDGAFTTARAVGVSDDGGVYVGGVTYGALGGPSVGDADAFLIAFDDAGARLPWSQQVAGHQAAGAHALAGVDRIALVGQDLVVWTLGEATPDWAVAPPEGARWTRVAESANGGLVAAGERDVQVDLPWWSNVDHVDVVVRHLAADGATLSEQRFGSLRDEATSALATWPLGRPGIALVGGWTKGVFLTPPTSVANQRAYVVEVELD